MRIKGDKIKENRELFSGRLYNIDRDRTIVFEEKDTNDIVNICYKIKDSQYGVYGKEFRPPFVEDNGAKKADILVLVIDEKKMRYASWVLDVKATVGGEDVILHLVGQLADSLMHKRTLGVYLDGFREEQHIGYITHTLERDRIQESIAKKEDYIKRAREDIYNMPALIGTEMLRKLLAEEEKLKVIVAFQQDSIKIGNEIFDLEHYISEKKNDKYVCNLAVECS